MKSTLFIAGALLFSCAQASVIFYGGDAAPRGVMESDILLDTWVFDDFDISAPSAIQNLWGNFFLTAGTTTGAAWEIRSDISSGDSGTLIASGSGAVTLTPTGRTLASFPEDQVMISGLNIVLNPGRYFMAIAVSGEDARGSLAITNGGDINTSGDPNPAPTGGPIFNGDSFVRSPGNNFVPADIYYGSPGTRFDGSYGVGGAVPEPATILGFLVGLAALAARRRQ
ncbi:MAG TPA: PEP-CTERM sorting domain-containing protein [Fimbriimonadales bacterium]|jgi:hypothetical protein|nr:PEP-CTERM sorting domain-containing protein [Fimbriimonadales bacterium]